MIRRIRQRALWMVPILVLLSAPAGATEYPPFHNLRFEEDWSEFEPAEVWYDQLKKLDVTDNIWLSIGGSSRVRLESWDDFAFSSADNDATYVAYRSFLHADVHVGDHLRVFIQGRYSNLTDRDLPGGKRDTLDVDRWDIWNTFIETNFSLGGADFMFRAGRQELQYGAERLIGPLNWSNTRRIFDGALARVTGPESRWRLDAFVTAPVIIDGDNFTFNDTDDDRFFSGVYYTRQLGNNGHGLDLYVLALNEDEDIAVADDRYTIGGRAWGPIAGNWSFEIEAAYQFGDTTIEGLSVDREEDIQAWMVTAEVTRSFPNTPWTPWATLGFDYASGDNDPDDDDNGTFDQLFPTGHAHLGFIDTIGRQNIIDARLTAGAWPIEKKLRLRADLHFFWRAEEDDGVYNAGGTLIRSPVIETEGGRILNISDDDIGRELDLTLLYKLNRNTTMLFGYSRFVAGDFVDKTGPDDDIEFAYAQIEFTF